MNFVAMPPAACFMSSSVCDRCLQNTVSSVNAHTLLTVMYVHVYILYRYYIKICAANNNNRGRFLM